MGLLYSPSANKYYDDESPNATPSDCVPYTPPAPPGPVLQDYENAVQVVLDTYAAAKGYRSADVMATFVSSTIAQWSAEALALVRWRDACWAAAYGLLQQYNAGLIAQPSVAQLVAALPSHP
jgi:hypothetical protein